MNTGKEAERNEHIKKKYANRFEERMGNKTQTEKEEVLVGERYLLKEQLMRMDEQLTAMKTRINVVGKFTIIDNTLAYDGVICEKEIHE
jgi:hypothetical protein